MRFETSTAGHLISSKIICFILFAVCCLIWLNPVSAETEGSHLILSFGVVPQQSATKLAKKWTPVLNYLSKKTGYRIDFKTSKNIPVFEERCSSGEYDLAYMNPYHYTVFNRSPGYRVFAKEKLKSLKGIIVVRKDSSLKELMGLENETLAFPSPVAFAASVVTRARLSKLGINFTPEYVSSHDSVYRSVAKDLYTAGGGVPRTFNNMAPEIRDQLRILWTSDGYTPHAIAAHPRVPDEVVRNIANAMTEMTEDPRGLEMLEQLNFHGLVMAKDSEWDDVRDLGIDIIGKPAK